MKKQRQTSQLFRTPPKQQSPVNQTATSTDLLSRAIALHRAGNFNDAEMLYHTLLASNPKHVQALTLLGTVHAQRGDCEEGIRLMEKAITIKPDHAEAYYNRGLIFQMLRRYSEALNSYDKALAIDCTYAEASKNRSITLYAMKRNGDALVSYEKAILLNPYDPTMYYNRGIILHEMKRYDDALANYGKAIALKPDYSEAYDNRGNTLQALQRHDESLADYDKAILLNPDHATTYHNRGITLHAMGRYDDALANYDKAIALKPDYPEAYTNRGVILQAEKRFDDAMNSYDKAIACNPTYAEAFWHKSLIHLTLGQYEEGWKLYEWRWKVNNLQQMRNLQQPLWLGNESLANKTILIHAEQAFGDCIQFCRYVPKVEALGAKVVFEVPGPLAGLMSTLKGSFRLIEESGPLPEFDLHCPLVSLPLAFKTLVRTIPADVPYLFADPHRRKIWQDRLGKKAKPRIGLTWSGRSRKLYDNRSIPLNLLAPLWHLDFDYHCIQKEFRDEDITALRQLGHIRTHADGLNDFSDTAALISEMDLIISVDTSVAHLVGALGKPLWVLLHYAPDWRWMLAREDSPWYPSARLFRQSSPDDWASVVARVTAELESFNLKQPA